MPPLPLSAPMAPAGDPRQGNVLRWTQTLTHACIGHFAALDALPRILLGIIWLTSCTIDTRSDLEAASAPHLRRWRPLGIRGSVARKCTAMDSDSNPLLYWPLCRPCHVAGQPSWFCLVHIQLDSHEQCPRDGLGGGAFQHCFAVFLRL